MALVPKVIADRIEFYEQHIAPWTTNAAALGVPVERVEALDARTQAARDAYAEQRRLMQAAKDATIRLQLALDDMGNEGASIISMIRATAQRTGSEGVYALASIPPRAANTALPAPGKPVDFNVQLNVIGELLLTWKGDNPAGATGTMYQVWRQIGVGGFVPLGVTGDRRFVDDTIPFGTTDITYQLQAVRSTVKGPKVQFNVRFGTNRQVTMSGGERALRTAA